MVQLRFNWPFTVWLLLTVTNCTNQLSTSTSMLFVLSFVVTGFRAQAASYLMYRQ